jgi:LPXTG-site transpeptidase (sortase) family protein
MTAPDHPEGAAGTDPAGAPDPDQDRAADPGIERMIGRVARWWVLSAFLLLIAVAFLASTLRSHQDSAAPQAAPLSAIDNHGVRTVPSSTAGPPGAEVPRRRGSPAQPVALRIPAIGVDTSLTTLGLNPDQTVEVPTDFGTPGWYKFGPNPGQPGSAVILCHYDSHNGPAVFYRLQNLQPGDSVEVTLTDGSVTHFAVTKVDTYLKTEFPADQVYGSHGDQTLQLVTCGGEFDADTHSYLSNIVAYTSLVNITRGAS